MNAPVARQAWQQWSCDNLIAVSPADRLPQARRIADRWMGRVERACSRFVPDSELRGIPELTETQVSPVLAELMRVALEAARRTGGLVDPTLGRAEEAIGYRVTMGGQLVAAPVALEAPTRHVTTAPPRVPWQAIRLDGDRLTLPAGATIDLGATAKAWTADRIAADCARSLDCGVLVSLGGDIATKESPVRTSWNVVVQDTDRDPADWLVLRGDGGVATSSVQHRTWLWQGRAVHHLLDPRTGQPVRSRWTHATVIAQSCVQANTWSTAALVAGDAAPALLRRQAVTARLVDSHGEVCTTGDWPHATDEAIGEDGTAREGVE
ncbi:FAD:protein FMN transferase [Pseudoclavibacter soli]|uniref:FAD:protein FMN transferase n=1 Tax=Pseudoclavibacter soli TaxID=452623 RepID=UPI0004233703|nr:FAD:protein FMN transferase [Pseudoclavibacter soli]